MYDVVHMQQKCEGCYTNDVAVLCVLAVSYILERQQKTSFLWVVYVEDY